MLVPAATSSADDSAFLAAVLDSLPIAICLLRGDDFRVERVNRAYQALAPGKPMVGATWASLWPDSGQDFEAICRRVMDTGVPYHAADEANVIRRRTGAPVETAYFSWTLHRVRLAGRDHFDLVGTAFETTDYLRAANEAWERDQWFRVLFESHPQPMWVFDQDTLQFLEVNDAAIARYGWSREEFRSMTITDIRPAEDVPRILESTRNPPAGLQDAGLWRHRTKDGTLLDVHVTAHAIPFAGRHGELVVATDVTERLRAEAALVESEEVNRVTFEHAAVGIAHVTPEGRFLRCNERFAAILGYAEHELRGLRVHDITHPDDLEGDLAAIERLLDGRIPSYTMEKRYLRRDASFVFATLTSSLVRHGDGSPRFLIKVIQDDTARREAMAEQVRLQEQLAQAQKMESVGRLAGGVAHDYNNMLGVILGYTELALQALPPEDPIAADLREVLAAAQQSAEITAQLLAFARKQAVVPRIIDLNGTVESMRKMLGRLVGEDLTIVWEPGERLWPVLMDPTQVHQVLANLCVNSRDAIDGTGRITLRTRNVTVDQVRMQAHPDLRPGDYVELSVTDDGSGMSPEVAAHMFEPFFTTKAIGKGTGLGLSTVFGIVRQNDGSIEVETEAGRGTTIRLLIPRAPQLVQAATSAATNVELPHGSETILFVEDEPALLRVAAAALRRLGYTVLTASTPAEAHRALAGADRPPALLVTDIIMPGQSGPELADELRAIVPTLAVLYVSGYPGGILEDRGLAHLQPALLPKPFAIADLAATIRRVLDD